MAAISNPIYQDQETSWGWAASNFKSILDTSELLGIFRNTLRFIPKNNIVVTNQLDQLIDLMSLPRTLSLCAEWINNGQIELNPYGLVSLVKSVSEIGASSCQAATFFLYLSESVTSSCSAWGNKLGFMADLTDAVQEIFYIFLHNELSKLDESKANYLPQLKLEKEKIGISWLQQKHKNLLTVHVVRLAAKTTVICCAIFEARISAFVPGGKQAVLLCAGIIKLWASHREATIGKFVTDGFRVSDWKWLLEKD